MKGKIPNDLVMPLLIAASRLDMRHRSSANQLKVKSQTKPHQGKKEMERRRKQMERSS